MLPLNHSPQKPAFSLIELLVSIAIFGILSILIAQFLVSFMNMKFNAETRQRIRQEGNYALDRIDFLIRNSITLPDICCKNRAIPCVALEPGKSQSYRGGLKFNTQGSGTNFFKRHRVKIINGELVVFSPTSSSTKHNDTTTGWWDNYDNSISLTTAKTGSSGTVPFTISNFIFSCSQDSFTKGYIVKIEFTITYDRKTFSSNSPPIIEKFTREVAVVNTNPFEN